jgi:hypothetical protein
LPTGFALPAPDAGGAPAEPQLAGLVSAQDCVDTAEPVKHFETTVWLPVLCDVLAGLVDPGDGGQLRWLRSAAAEPVRVGGIGGFERVGPLGAHLGRSAVVEQGGGVIGDARVAVLVVVVGEEGRTERQSVLDRAETLGEGLAVLERLEVGLGNAVSLLRVRWL